MSAPFTYPEVGATGRRPLPPGYRHLTHRAVVGTGADLPAAAEALLSWRMHRAVGLQVEVSAPRAAPGARVTSWLGFGPFTVTAPCQVVWTVEDEHRAGFAYGTLPGHPAHGEESFVASREGDVVWLTVTSFSRPARWYMRAAGPAARLFQRAYARRCARALRRLCRAG